ncbi:MAG: MFS transporter [Caulobacteraceae bacterium]
MTTVSLNKQREVDRSARPPLTKTVKTFYGMGALSGAAGAQLLGLLLLFYNQLVGLPASWVSGALAISIFIDAIWDPIVGQMSDSTRTRWGRRHPYIYGAVLPAAMCFALLFMPPVGWSAPALFFYLLGMIIAMRMFSSLYDIPGVALAPELTQDYEERTNLQSYRFIFTGAIGGLIAAVLGFGYFLRGTKANPFGQFNEAGYGPYAITIAAIGLVAVVASGVATHRFIPYLHKPVRQRLRIGALLRVMGTALSNRNFMSLAGSLLLYGIAQGLAGGLNFYFETYVFELGSKALLILRLSILPASLAGVFLAPATARLFDKKRACIIAFLLCILSGVVPLGAWLLGLMPPHAPWVLPVLIVDRLFVAALATIGFIIIASMIADVVEASQLKTGRRSEGLLYAAESLLRKVSTSFAALLPGLILAIVAFPRHARPGHVSVQILTHLVWIFLPIHTIFVLVAVATLMFYRLNRSQHEDNLRQLAGAAAIAAAAETQIGSETLT